MPPRRGLCLCEFLISAVVIEASRAIELNTPSDFSPNSPEDTFEVSWTPSSGDPRLFDLDVLCNTTTSSTRLIAGVATDASPQHPIVPPSIWFQVIKGKTVICILQAKDAVDGSTVLTTSSPFQVSPKGSTPPTISRVPPKTFTLSTVHDTPVTTRTPPTLTRSTSDSRESTMEASTVLMTPSNPVFGSSSASTITSLSLSTSASFLPTTTPQIQPTASASKKNISVGTTVVGALLGGLGLLAILVIATIVCWRRRRRKYPTLTPLPYNHVSTQPLGKNGRPAQVLTEKAAAQQQRPQLRIQVEDTSLEDGRAHIAEPFSVDTARTVLHQVLRLSERIQALEVQQREEYSDLRSPPDYTSGP